MSDTNGSRVRCVAFVGPLGSGKTTLVESLLQATEAIPRKGSITGGNTVGDPSPEARARQMSVEVSISHTEYLGDRWTYVDCPGSLEFSQDMLNAVAIADVAVVVCEPDPARAVTIAPILKALEHRNVPHMIFVNKVDNMNGRVRDLLEALQGLHDSPLVLRQVPIREDEAITGYVDLVSERAYHYKPGEASDLIKIPEASLEREQEARTELLESLADFDDALLEQLLEDAVPSAGEVYDQLSKDLVEGLITPVFLGSANNDGGTRRLLKALRHEAPGPEAAAARNGISGDEPVMQVFKTLHLSHTGKLSLARIWSGEVKDGMTFDGERISGLYHLMGYQLDKLSSAGAGDVVGLGRMDNVQTGDVLAGGSRTAGALETLPPLFGLAVTAKNRNDEVKLSGVMQKLCEEDPSLHLNHNQDTREMVLWGQGDIHLRTAVDRLKSKYNLEITTHQPQVSYKETISKSTKQHSRHKRQTGGHGQFGDVHVEIKPLPRGSGVDFSDSIVGGAIPKQFIPSVEAGVREYASEGPLGFPLVDFQVNLFDGSYHSVDSSDMAFKTAGRLAMSEGIPKCGPVLLEPIYNVSISVPNEYTSKVQRLVTGRRGHLLGFDAKAGWSGWDEVKAQMPQAEMQDLIIELRSLSQGVGTYEMQFDRLQELVGRQADQVVQQRQEAKAS